MTIVVSLLFFCSGFAALVYELLWMRQLGLIFGNTVYAATTVFTAYMGGLAFGAHLFGKQAGRSWRPVRLFGLLNLVIGLYALAMPVLFSLMRITYRAAYQHMSDSLWVLTPLRFALAIAVMLVPTMCMGGTLPVLARALLRKDERFGSRLGWLYGINTLGAVAGLLASGFILIARIGVSGANTVAVLLNLLVAGGALMLGATGKVDEPVPGTRDALEVGMPNVGTGLATAVLLSGFVALALEVVWFRALVLVFGSTTYSFSAMLSVMLFGMALGSLALGWLADRSRFPVLVFGGAQIAMGLFTLFSLRWFNRMPMFLLEYLNRESLTWEAITGARFLITTFFLLVPSIFMGLSFTAATKTVRRALGVSHRAVGRAYTLNTMGGVLGSCAGGFLLLPVLGAERSLLVLAGVALLIGALLVLTSRAAVKPVGVTLALVLLLGTWGYATHPGWNQKLMAVGPYFAPWGFLKDGDIVLRERMDSEEVLLYKEGLVANVAVTRSDDQALYFSSDGKVEADTTSRSMMLQRMMGHLPMLFHPNPKRVVNIGLGAGVTFGALSCYPVDHLEVVEIEPAVRAVAKAFARWNHDVLASPRAHVTMGDGRNHLFCTTMKYDVITSDPFEPVYSGANNLYTVEHFRQARMRLAEGGIMCQYLPLYELSKEDFSMIVRSFVTVFPKCAMFYTGDDTLLLGFNGEMKLDPAVLRSRFAIPEVKASLAGIGIEAPELILGMFVADLSKSDALFGKGALNTDAHPYVEFSAPKNALRYTSNDNMELLLQNFTALPQSFLEGLDEAAAKTVLDEHEGLKVALEANARKTAGENQVAYDLLEKASALAPLNPVIRDDFTRLLRSSAETLQGMGNLQDAAYQYQLVLRLNQDDFWSLHRLIVLAMQAGNQEFAGQLIDRAMTFYPESPLFMALKGKYVGTVRGDWTSAVEWLRKATDLAPWKADLWRDYAVVAKEAGDMLTMQMAIQEVQRIEATPPW